MKLSQIVKFVVKKKVIKLFRLRLKFRPRRTQTNLIEKFLKTLEASQRFDSLFRPVLFRQWSKNQLMVKKDRYVGQSLKVRSRY